MLSILKSLLTLFIFVSVLVNIIVQMIIVLQNQIGDFRCNNIYIYIYIYRLFTVD